MPRSEDKPTISVTPTNKLATNLKDLSSAKVIKIHDGDTISADSGQGVIKIRLACIDAPESNQKPWGETLPNLCSHSLLSVQLFNTA